MSKIAIVDLETTGSNFEQGDRIIQFACLIIENGQLVDEINYLINPNRRISTTIYHLTGIDNSMVEDAPTFSDVADELYYALNDCYFVAHQLSFDLPFLKKSFKECGIEDFTPIALDSLAIAKICFPTVKSYSLSSLMEELGYIFTDAHNALYDCQATYELLKECEGIVSKWDEALRNKISNITKYLPKQTYMFFDQNASFEFNESFLDKYKPFSIKEKINDSYLDAQVAYLEELWSREDNLIYEADSIDFTFSYMETFLESRLQKNTRTLVVVPEAGWVDELSSKHLDIKVLKKPTDFFPYNAKDINFSNELLSTMNQKEIILAAGLCNWLTFTETGAFSELNIDLEPRDFIDKYHQKPYDYYYFNKYLEKCKDSKVLLSSSNNFNYYCLNPKLKDNLEGFDLVIMQANKWAKNLRFYQKEHLYLSDAITCLNTFHNELYERYNMPALANDVYYLIEELFAFTDYLTKHHLPKPKVSRQQQENRTIYLPCFSSEFITLSTKIKKINETYQLLDLKLQKNSDVFSKSYYFSEFKKYVEIWQNLSKLTKEYNLTWLLKASLINGAYYHFELVVYPKKVKNINTILKPFTKVLMFVEEVGVDELELQIQTLADYKKTKAPALYQGEKQDVYFPVQYVSQGFLTEDLTGYLQTSERAIIAVEGVSLALGEDYFIKGKSLLILTQTRAVTRLMYYQLMNQKHVREAYPIYAQGISGSLQKISRNSADDRPKIVIVEAKSILKEHWVIDDDFEVVILNLPFKSPDNAFVKEQGEIMKLSDDDIFNEILLKDMTNVFFNLVDYLKTHFKTENLYIFDDRVYTKSYSSEFQNNLAPYINFIFDQ